uniref:Transposase Tnp1/En/Spm-like domain-containing protein n=1 Tax=Arundo donax TaxID=35708 RepID=A0A0A8ZG98_ARUDO
MNKTQEHFTQNKIPRCVNKKKTRPSAMEVGTTLVLKSAKYPNKEPVAYATFISCDPDAQVGGVALGTEFWKVRVTFPIEANEVLVRPWQNYKIIGDTKGISIAWPSIFVEKVNG